jgi:hypothetical protein
MYTINGLCAGDIYGFRSRVTGVFFFVLLNIMFINITLSGDNAVVIAVAVRSLPKKERQWGIALHGLQRPWFSEHRTRRSVPEVDLSLLLILYIENQRLNPTANHAVTAGLTDNYRWKDYANARRRRQRDVYDRRWRINRVPGVISSASIISSAPVICSSSIITPLSLVPSLPMVTASPAVPREERRHGHSDDDDG